MQVEGLHDASDIAACNKSSQLYIADWGPERVVWRIGLLSPRQTDLFLKLQWEPYSLSVKNSRLLITTWDGDSLYLYDNDGKLLHRIQLPYYMDATHSVETTRETFIVSYYNNLLDGRPEHRDGVTEVDISGRIVRRFDDDFNSVQLGMPQYLVLYNKHVIVADYFHGRFIALNPGLELQRILVNGVQSRRLCLTSSRLLVVSFWSSTNIGVFKV